MSYLLDTNVVSALRRKDRAEGRVIDWFDSVAGAEFFVSALTMMEIEIGIRRLARADKWQADMLRAWRDGPLQALTRGHCLNVDLEIAECCAALHVPDPRPEIDALIGATAIIHRLKLVTRNVRDFAGMPVVVIDPWDLPRR